MAKKVNALLTGTLIKNNVKGGAWLASYSINYEGVESPISGSHHAFSNASAGKRWLKEMTIANTPKKSIKMVAGTALDEKSKPLGYQGEVKFKIEA
jgi:hypothetical protein